MTEARHHAHGYELFMLGLSLYAVVVFVLEALVPMAPAIRDVLGMADVVVCAVFLADFVRSVRLAPDKGRYLVTWGWLDLLSSIPYLPLLRAARVARVARILRVLRAVRAARTVTSFATGQRVHTAAYAVAFGCLLLVVLGSAAALHLEAGTASPIKSAGDALWWSIGTLTTVGFADLHPVTAEGRLVGILLMTAGVALLGTVTGLLASWFLSPGEDQQDADLKALRTEVAALRALMEERLPGRTP